MLYPYYESRLHDYGRRLTAGDEYDEETRKYVPHRPQRAVLQEARGLLLHQLRAHRRFGRAELWYSPDGFDAMPADLAHMNRNGVYEWVPLAPQWAACYR